MNEADKLLAASLIGNGDALMQLVARHAPQLLIDLLEHHGISALLYNVIRNQDAWPGLPEEVKSYLDTTAKQSAAIDLARRHAERQVFMALKAADIPAVLIKGAALSRTHYASPGLRSRSDSDVLIPLDRIEQVLAVFKALGYSIPGAGYKSHQFECYGTAAGGIAIMFDIHWRISNAPRFARVIDFSELYDRSAEIDDSGFKLRVTSVTDSLLIALIHRIANPLHDKNRLIWLYDIHLIVLAMNEPELDDAIEIFKSKGISKECIEGLRVTNEYFPGEKTKALLKRLEAVPRVVTASSRFQQSYAGLIWDDLKVLPNWSSRFRLIKELLFPPADFVLQKYGYRSRMMLPILYIWRLMSVGLKRVFLK